MSVPGAVIRPLVEPVPVYPWAIVHRRDATHPALATLRSVATELVKTEGWLATPDGAWLPAAEARVQARP